MHLRTLLSWIVGVALVFAVAAPVAARRQKAAAEPVSSPTPTCDRPCAHAADCPKVTCECDGAAAAGVAACDTDVTHCCVDASTACERFCEVHHQKWTGRSTPEESDAPPASTSDAPRASTCDAPCHKGEDCRTITCRCANDIVAGVAACDGNTNCCADARIVCEHYCTGKKGKWTGKLVEAPSQRPSMPSLLGDPDDDDGLYDPDDEELRR